MQEEQWSGERAERHAGWAKLTSRLYYAPFARRIVRELAPLNDGSTLVDLGTGSGALSIELGKLLRRVRIIGIDPSSDMLEIARENARHSAIPNYEARLGRAEEIPLESSSVDLVISQSSFHEWENRGKGLSEVLRVLKPGGSFILRDYNRGWLSGWKLTLLKPLGAEHMDMFKFTLQEVVRFVQEAGFDRVEVKGKGFTMLVQAWKAGG